MSLTPLCNFIGGKYVPAKTDKYVDVINPATGRPVTRVPLSTATDLDDAVKVGKAAFEVWSNMTMKQRAGIMFKFHELLDQHSEELVALIILENGKNAMEAAADIAKGNETVDWACGLPHAAAGRTLEVSRGIQCTESKEPLGVVGAIVPFNFPVMVPMWTLPISLVMGNCVILKPSEKVPMAMQRCSELLTEAGLPAGVFQIVHGAVDIVNAICEHPDISAVSFVGSSKVAEIVYNKCNALNKRVLCLGGAKNHLIALPDADVGMTTRDVVVSFAGCAGQRCMAASVLIVVGENQPLIDEIVSLAGKLEAGQGNGQVGPVIDHIARDRIVRYINDAENSTTGAKILLDGRSWGKTRPDGFWVGPTVILHKSAQDAAMQDEIFGPVLSIIQVDSWDEAIAIENANPYGNAACIYTEKGANADWFIKRFRAAMLGVNIGIPVPREPFSFGGLYGTRSKYGNCDITGDGAMEFFSNRRKVTQKWTASYGTTAAPAAKRVKVGDESAAPADKANFDGRM
jgi:malonate-semialdehyde dehydrogenase (acetylating) / methylmalonate-semialdehyde dehydrogenase